MALVRVDATGDGGYLVDRPALLETFESRDLIVTGDGSITVLGEC